MAKENKTENNGNGEEDLQLLKIDENERIAQGIFLKFLEADNGNSSDERKGGIGSTSI